MSLTEVLHDGTFSVTKANMASLEVKNLDVLNLPK